MHFFHRYSSFLVLLVSAILTLIVFWPVATHLNTAMFTYSGDGLKNYFAVTYYLQHNSGLHFTGMNYPFGEHLSFADGQPALALPYKWISYLFPSLSMYGIGLTNAAVLLGIIIAPYFLYKILKRFEVIDALAFPAALLICFLSPQFFRIEGHYALSYPAFFCAAWYLFLVADEKQAIRSTALLILFITWIGLLHFYLAAIVVLFVGVYNLTALFVNWKNTSLKQQLLRWASVLVPIIVLQLFMLTDSVTDRPYKPWGFFYATSDWTSVFLPHIVDLFGNPAKPLFNRYWEGFAYIGVAPNLFCVAFILHHIVRFVTPGKKAPLFTTQQYMFLTAAVLLLLFSMSIPFKWGLEAWVDRLPMLRQFRAPGRFAWPFYYVTGVLAVVYFSQLLKATTKPILKRSLVVIATAIGLVWTSECSYRMIDRHALAERAVGYHRIIAEQNISDLLMKSGHYANEFQAVLTLPYFHVGSEKFSMSNGLSEIHAMKASLQTGLPLMNVMMSRTSLEQSRLSMQFFSDSLIDKKIIPLLNKKPLLVLVTPQELTESEKQMVGKSKLLSSQNGWSLYALQPQELTTNQMALKELFAARHSGYKNYGSYFSNDSGSVATLLFADTVAGITTTTTGELFEKQANKIIQFRPKNAGSADSMHLSVWLSIDANTETFPVLVCTQQDATGKDIHYAEATFKRATDIYGNNALASTFFAMRPEAVQLKLILYNSGRIYNLLLRRKNETVLIPSGRSFYFNNIFIP